MVKSRHISRYAHYNSLLAARYKGDELRGRVLRGYRTGKANLSGGIERGSKMIA